MVQCVFMQQYTLDVFKNYYQTGILIHSSFFKVYTIKTYNRREKIEKDSKYAMSIHKMLTFFSSAKNYSNYRNEIQNLELPFVPALMPLLT